MKATDPFKSTIQAYLEQYATTDELFADKLKNPSKNIEQCITYIMNTVKKSGCNGFADDEIFNMAIHYYDEQKIEVGKPLSGTVVVNHHVVITEEEKAAMKQKALSDLVSDEKRRLTQKKPTTTKAVEVQGSLF
jgi:hypothetical protein